MVDADEESENEGIYSFSGINTCVHGWLCSPGTRSTSSTSSISGASPGANATTNASPNTSADPTTNNRTKALALGKGKFYRRGVSRRRGNPELDLGR